MTKNEFLSTSFLVIGFFFVAGCCFLFFSAAYFGNPVSEYIINYRGVVVTSILSIIAGRLLARENRVGRIIGMPISLEAVLETIVSGFSHRDDESLAPIVAVISILLLIFQR